VYVYRRYLINATLLYIEFLCVLLIMISSVQFRGAYGCWPLPFGIGVTYEGVPVPSTFWTGDTVPPLFRSQVKNLLSSEAICDQNHQITLKSFSAGAICPGPHHQRAPVSLSRVASQARQTFEGGLAGLSPQTLTRLYFFLLTCATI